MSETVAATPVQAQAFRPMPPPALAQCATPVQLSLAFDAMDDVAMHLHRIAVHGIDHDSPQDTFVGDEDDVEAGESVQLELLSHDGYFRQKGCTELAWQILKDAVICIARDPELKHEETVAEMQWLEGADHGGVRVQDVLRALGMHLWHAAFVAMAKTNPKLLNERMRSLSTSFTNNEPPILSQIAESAIDTEMRLAAAGPLASSFMTDESPGSGAGEGEYDDASIVAGFEHAASRMRG